MTILTLYVTFTLNNIIFNLTNPKGNSLFLISKGFLRVKPTKKNLAKGAETCFEKIAKKLKILKVKKLHLIIKGLNRGRKSTLQRLKHIKTLPIISLKETTYKPFNGCKLKKAKRV